MNRRKFLTGAAALAASSLVPIKPFAFDTETDLVMDLFEPPQLTAGWLRMVANEMRARLMADEVLCAFTNEGFLEITETWNKPPLSGSVSFAQITERYEDLLKWEKEHA